jgi:F-type H+-transporting ATPase subunit epsilon
MANTVYLEIVTPAALIFSGEVSQVDIPGEMGYFGVLPNHAPLIASLAPGVVSLYEGQGISQRFYIGGGVAEVTPERCTILATSVLDMATASRTEIEKELNEVKHNLNIVIDENKKHKLSLRAEALADMLKVITF